MILMLLTEMILSIFSGIALRKGTFRNRKLGLKQPATNACKLNKAQTQDGRLLKVTRMFVKCKLRKEYWTQRVTLKMTKTIVA